MSSKPPLPSRKEKESIAQNLLSRAHSPTTATTIFTEKIKSRPLYLKPTEPDPNAQRKRRRERENKIAARRKSKQKPKPLSSREKKRLGIYDLPKSEVKYKIYEGLHQMWLGYIREVLDVPKCLPVGSGGAAKLCSADYHGAKIMVVRSGCPSRVGVGGIVVKDSKHAFEVVTERDERKVLVKEGCVFRVVVPIEGPADQSEEKNWKPEDGKPEDGKLVNGQAKEVKEKEKADLVFELHGDQFIYRAADRANRKFKSHFLPDL